MEKIRIFNHQDKQIFRISDVENLLDPDSLDFRIIDYKSFDENQDKSPDSSIKLPEGYDIEKVPRKYRNRSRPRGDTCYLQVVKEGELILEYMEDDCHALLGYRRIFYQEFSKRKYLGFYSIENKNGDEIAIAVAVKHSYGDLQHDELDGEYHRNYNDGLFFSVYDVDTFEDIFRDGHLFPEDHSFEFGKGSPENVLVDKYHDRLIIRSESGNFYLLTSNSDECGPMLKKTPVNPTVTSNIGLYHLGIKSLISDNDYREIGMYLDFEDCQDDYYWDDDDLQDNDNLRDNEIKKIFGQSFEFSIFVLFENGDLVKINTHNKEKTILMSGIKQIKYQQIEEKYHLRYDHDGVFYIFDTQDKFYYIPIRLRSRNSEEYLEEPIRLEYYDGMTFSSERPF